MSVVFFSGIYHVILLYGVNPWSSGLFLILSALCGSNVASVNCVKGCLSFSYLLTFILFLILFLLNALYLVYRLAVLSLLVLSLLFVLISLLCRFPRLLWATPTTAP